MPYIIAVLALVIIGISTPFLSSRVGVVAEEVTDAPKELVENTIEKVAVLVDMATGTEEIEETSGNGNSDTDDSPTSATPAVSETTPTPTTQTNTNTNTTATVPTGTYADGTYTTSKTYRTPDGSYTMNVSLTVTNDTVTAVSTTFDSKAQRDSYTKRFTNSYQSYVLGKDLKSVNLSRVGGASLTTDAFNSALNAIRSQAS